MHCLPYCSTRFLLFPVNCLMAVEGVTHCLMAMGDSPLKPLSSKVACVLAAAVQKHLRALLPTEVTIKDAFSFRDLPIPVRQAKLGFNLLSVGPKGELGLAAMDCRLTKQVSAFYDDVLRLLSAAPLSQHFDKSWTSHVQVKATLYDVESQLQQAAQLHKDDDIAPEIARLKVIQRLT